MSLEVNKNLRSGSTPTLNITHRIFGKSFNLSESFESAEIIILIMLLFL